MKACLLLADKALDADERVITLLANQNKAVVIPPKSNRKMLRDYDREIYKARHLIENFFANSSNSERLPRVMTKPHEISSPVSTWSQCGGLVGAVPE